jgi:hypothetical protein
MNNLPLEPFSVLPVFHPLWWLLVHAPHSKAQGISLVRLVLLLHLHLK